MNSIRVLKIITALIVLLISFVFIPMLLPQDYFALRMSCYVILGILLIFTFYKLFKEVLNKDRSGLPVYDYGKEQSIDILISPERVIFFSLFMILFSFAVISFMGFGGFLLRIRWTRMESYPPLIPFFAFCFIFLKGIQLWMRRDKVLQLSFSQKGIAYMPVNINGVGRGRGASIISMYFRTKMIFLAYNNINAIAIEKNAWRGDMIRLTTVSHEVIYLPFLSNDINQIEAVYETLVERWNHGKRNIADTHL